MFSFLSFFFNDTATTYIYTLSLHDALPISFRWIHLSTPLIRLFLLVLILLLMPTLNFLPVWFAKNLDRKSGSAGMPRPISYAVFCLKKKSENRSTAERNSSAPPGSGPTDRL